MSKINEFTETYSGAFNGYKALADLMVATECLPSVMETDIEVKGVEGTFNVRCFDGIALAVNDEMNVVLEYPKKYDMTHDQLKDCLSYRGLDKHISVIGEFTRAKVTYGDIMMLLGNPIMIHNKQ